MQVFTNQLQTHKLLQIYYNSIFYLGNNNLSLLETLHWIYSVLKVIHVTACRSAEERVRQSLLQCVRLDVARGAGQRTPCGACAAGVGSYRRRSQGQVVCCTLRPPPRFRRPLRLVRRDSPAWTWARRRSSSSTWSVGSETIPDTQMMWLLRACAGSNDRHYSEE